VRSRVLFVYKPSVNRMDIDIETPFCEQSRAARQPGKQNKLTQDVAAAASVLLSSLYSNRLWMF